MRRGLNEQYKIRKLLAKLKQQNIIKMEPTGLYFHFDDEPWLRPGFKDNALLEFQVRDFNTIEAGDIFFQQFGAGNSTQGHYDALKQARFDYYLALLDEMQRNDPAKYQNIFKGTPFYIMAWIKFQQSEFEKAVFFMDAAISEDLHKLRTQYRLANLMDTSPDDYLDLQLQPNLYLQQSGRFFLLDSGIHTMQTIVESIKDKIITGIQNFNNITQSSLTFEHFRDNFIKVLITTSKGRSIITSLYSFMIAIDSIQQEARLRSNFGGSLEPIINHLFKGAIVVESLLKLRGYTGQTLGAIYRSPQFITNHGGYGGGTSAHSLVDIINAIGSYATVNEEIFGTTIKVRNTTGHSLAWDDVFNNPVNLSALQTQVSFAIFLVCSKDY